MRGGEAGASVLFFLFCLFGAAVFSWKFWALVVLAVLFFGWTVHDQDEKRSADAKRWKQQK